jgi:hypothetical protein
MILEIFLGFLISILLIYLWFLYLKWGDGINEDIELYNYNSSLIRGSKKETIENWGWLSPSMVLSDTYKYINFWILYYKTRLFI